MLVARASSGLNEKAALGDAPAIAHGLDAAGTHLCIARTRLPIASVRDYEVSGLARKDFHSNLATAAAFGGVAVLMLAGTLTLGWRDRFLIASVLLGAIAVFALLDIGRNRWLTSYTFDLTMDDGARHRFVTADSAVAHRLRDALDAHLA